MASNSPRRDLTDAEIAMLRIRANEFLDSDLWRAMVDVCLTVDQRRIMRTLVDPAVGGEQLKFTQGELAQVNRDILLVETFIDALTSESERRVRAMERKG